MADQNKSPTISLGKEQMEAVAWLINLSMPSLIKMQKKAAENPDGIGGLGRISTKINKLARVNERIKLEFKGAE